MPKPTLTQRLNRWISRLKNDISRGRPGADTPGFRRQYAQFRQNGLGRIDSAFNALYLQVAGRVERSRVSVSTDRSHLCAHPLGWKNTTAQKPSVFWGGLFWLLTRLPYWVCKPFSFLKRLFSSHNSRDNALRASQDALRWVRKRLYLIVPLALAIGVFSYMGAAADAEVVLGARVNGTDLGLIESTAVMEAAVDQVEDKASAVLGRSFKFPYEVSYYFADRSAFMTQSQLVSALLTCLGEYISPGYGLYIDDKLVAAAPALEDIQLALDELVQEESQGNSPYTVELLNSVRTSSETFPTQKLVNKEQLKQLLRFGSCEYTVLSTLDNIHTVDYRVCHRLSLSFADEVGSAAFERARKAAQDMDFTNTYYYYEDLGQEEDAPEGALVTFAYSKLVSTVDTVSFTTQRINDPNRWQGWEATSTYGKNGRAVVTTKYTYVDGKLVSQTPVETQIFQAPVTQVIRVGTKPLPETLHPGQLNIFIKPVEGRITSAFGDRVVFGEAETHKAIDLEAPMRTPVYASLSGTVIRAESHDSYGNHVILQHDNGYQTYYAHLDEIQVQVGQRVKQGQKLGLSGATGRVTGPHLHFELRKPSGTSINPVPYFYKEQ